MEGHFLLALIGRPGWHFVPLRAHARLENPPVAVGRCHPASPLPHELQPPAVLHHVEPPSTGRVEHRVPPPRAAQPCRAANPLQLHRGRPPVFLHRCCGTMLSRALHDASTKVLTLVIGPSLPTPEAIHLPKPDSAAVLGSPWSTTQLDVEVTPLSTGPTRRHRLPSTLHH
jgi:hypothetical protein